jgi:hypothetical protein
MAKTPPDPDPTADEVEEENLRFLRGLQQKALRKLTTPRPPRPDRTANAK